MPARRVRTGIAALALATAWGCNAHAADDDLAKKVANPISSLVSLPIQLNWDHELGENRDGRKFQANIQPVIPASLGGEWTLVSRVIVPLVDQRIPGPGDGRQRGAGDITGEFFFVAPPRGGFMWGVGPAVLVPTSVDFISADKWGAGLAGVVIEQHSGWTYGALVSHLSSVGGSGAQEFSNTLVQPILSHTTKDAWTYGINSEATYDWKHSRWSVPINATVSKLVRFGKQPVSLGGGLRYWASGPDSGPHGWGIRLSVTFLFPE